MFSGRRSTAVISVRLARRHFFLSPSSPLLLLLCGKFVWNGSRLFAQYFCLDVRKAFVLGSRDQFDDRNLIVNTDGDVDWVAEEVTFRVAFLVLQWGAKEAM